MKTCRKCRAEKPPGGFYRNSELLDGLSSWCKQCNISSSVARQRANPAVSQATQKRWRQRNPEKCRQKSLKFARANPEKKKAWSRAWQKANPEKRFAAELRRNFGITPGDYRAMLAAQGGVCAICRKPEKIRQRLAVDHDHATGKVRGLLCRDCNTSLGKFGDSLEILRNAVAYLEKQ